VLGKLSSNYKIGLFVDHLFTLNKDDTKWILSDMDKVKSEFLKFKEKSQNNGIKPSNFKENDWDSVENIKVNDSDSDEQKSEE